MFSLSVYYFLTFLSKSLLLLNFQNFAETQSFLNELEQKCGSKAEVKRLHEHPQYLSFLQLWNLPVYFQIRFQEIAGSLEAVMFQWPKNIKSASNRFQLTPTSAAWEAAQMCWNSKIFLFQLAHRYFPLHMYFSSVLMCHPPCHIK